MSKCQTVHGIFNFLIFFSPIAFFSTFLHFFLGSLPAYQAAFTSLLVKTRRRVAVVQGDTSAVNTGRPKISHSDVLSGGKKNFSVIKSRKVDISMLTGKFRPCLYFELVFWQMHLIDRFCDVVYRWFVVIVLRGFDKFFLSFVTWGFFLLQLQRK